MPSLIGLRPFARINDSVDLFSYIHSLYTCDIYLRLFIERLGVVIQLERAACLHMAFGGLVALSLDIYCDFFGIMHISIAEIKLFIDTHVQTSQVGNF